MGFKPLTFVVKYMCPYQNKNMPILKDDIVHLRFGLTHHSHTGRRLHKSHTSYPLLVLLIMMVGLVMAAMTFQVRAADIFVTASANGPTPVQPAVILSPLNDSRFTDSSIPVSGTCEPGYYIKLFRNEIFSGSTLCTPGGTFSIVTDLFAGRNDLQARTFNVADNEGPASTIITVWYDVPVDPEDPEIPEQPTPGTDPPYSPGGRPDPDTLFYLSTEYFFKAAYSGQRIAWDFKIMGGSGPYTVYVTWGDGYSDVKRGVSGDSFTIEHWYNTLKEKREYYSMIVRVQDNRGHNASLQLVAIMNDPDIISGALVKPNDPGPLSPAGWLTGALKLLWSVYGLLLLMAVSFWLGERRGYSLAAHIRRRRAARA